MDLPTIVVISLLLFVFGLLIFRLSRTLLRRIIKDTSNRNINLLSGVCAFILSPIIVMGIFALIIYISTESASKESEEELVRNHYQMMDEDIAEDLKIGMSKTEVVDLFGENDTTKTIMTYDLSIPKASEKYILEITFDNGGLIGFRRQR